jgi:hypothetical protein
MKRWGRDYGGTLLGFASMFLLWHVAAVYVVGSALFPPPAAVIVRAGALLRDGTLLAVPAAPRAAGVRVGRLCQGDGGHDGGERRRSVLMLTTLLREDTMGFAVKCPATWRVGRSTGTLESVLLSEPAPAGAPGVSMQLFVQRNVNPRGLPIEQWYADQLKRFNVTTRPPTTSTVIGGRPAIRQEMSRTLDKRYDFYTAINAADVFQVSIIQPVAPARLDRTHEAVLSTITFLK